MDVTTQGRSFPSKEFLVGERLSSVAFARALGLEDPLLLHSQAAREQGFTGRLVLPAMLGFHLAVSGDDLVEGLGFTWGRTLNLGIDVDWAGVAVTEEDELHASARVVATWERVNRRGGVRQFARIRTDFTMAGQPVCRCEVVFTEVRDGVPDPTVPTEPRSHDAEPFAHLPSASLPAIDGKALPEHRTPEMTRLSMARLSVATDNPDPLHLDDDIARAAGFDGVLGHGAVVVGLLHEPVRRTVGLLVPTRLETSQTASFTLGNSLIGSGEVDGVAGPDSAQFRTSVRDEAARGVGSATVKLGVAVHE